MDIEKDLIDHDEGNDFIKFADAEQHGCAPQSPAQPPPPANLMMVSHPLFSDQPLGQHQHQQDQTQQQCVFPHSNMHMTPQPIFSIGQPVPMQRPLMPAQMTPAQAISSIGQPVQVPMAQRPLMPAQMTPAQAISSIGQPVPMPMPMPMAQRPQMSAQMTPAQAISSMGQPNGINCMMGMQPHMDMSSQMVSHPLFSGALG